ncbi:hypothetical protein ACVXHB_25370 [Escherichia coli]
MNVFSTQRYKALFWLIAYFILLVITSSNYLVQLPRLHFGFHTTWARLAFRLFSCYRPDLREFLAHRWPDESLFAVNDPCA